jgi:hypothetical protein
MSKKTFIFNGCSMTWGAEATKDNSLTEDDYLASYPFKFGKINKLANIENIAAPGASNSRIFCSNIDYLFQHIDKKDDFIFVTQWTDINRILDPNIVLDYAKKTKEEVPWEDPYFSSPFSLNKFYPEIFWNQTLAQAISWHRVCESYGIKNLNWFFCNNYWDHVQKKHIKIFELKSPIFPWGGITQSIPGGNPRENTVYDLSNIYDYMKESKSFMIPLKFLKVMTKLSGTNRAGDHPTEEGHEKWAKILDNYMREHKFYD